MITLLTLMLTLLMIAKSDSHGSLDTPAATSAVTPTDISAAALDDNPANIPPDTFDDTFDTL